MDIKTKICTVVKKIPKGKVMSYSSVSDIVGCTPFVVGRILSGMSKNDYHKIPWQRVVAKNGYISSLKLGFKGSLQKKLLISEGYHLNQDFVDMYKHNLSSNQYLNVLKYTE